MFEACKNVGYPECRINLAYGATYLSRCRKNQDSYRAINQAQDKEKNIRNDRFERILR